MHAVIMAGGRGTRFWPRSRERKPKHLLDIVGTRTMIQETVDRIKPLVTSKNILIVTGKKHARELIKQLPEVPTKNIIIEPEGKNTASCIGLAALHIQKITGDDVMIVLPSDHTISDPRKYLEVIAAAAQFATKENALVTIGIKPSGPNTGFGYLERSDSAVRISSKEIFSVKSIHEKPDLQKAVTFLQSGNFYWNSGMFIWKASIILKEIERWLPDLNKGLMKIKDVLGSSRERATIRSVYKKLASISIDYGVMEKADNVFMLKGNFGWSDVGSWDTLWEISDKDNNGNALIGGGQIISEGAAGSLIYSPQKMVALVGVKDLIIVETKDALLVCPRGQSQQVKKVVDNLEQKKLKKYL
jgi:mannose-1-phosphate guanylyltransferase